MFLHSLDSISKSDLEDQQRPIVDPYHKPLRENHTLQEASKLAREYVMIYRTSFYIFCIP